MGTGQGGIELTWELKGHLASGRDQAGCLTVMGQDLLRGGRRHLSTVSTHPPGSVWALAEQELCANHPGAGQRETHREKAPGSVAAVTASWWKAVVRVLAGWGWPRLSQESGSLVGSRTPFSSWWTWTRKKWGRQLLCPDTHEEAVHRRGM